eukprot:403335031
MYNFYLYDKMEKDQESRRVSTSKEQRRDIKYNYVRDQMAEKYKERITNFLQDMTLDPIQQDDHYKIDPKSVIDLTKIKGREYFKYSNNATDQERINDSMRKNEFLDNKPPEKIEKYAWNMRPRSKEREIGPEIKHNHKLQIERIYDQLNKRKSPIFQDINLTDHQLHHQARAFVKSGSIKRHQSFNAHSGNMTRESKLGFNNFFGNPTLLMSQLHNKSHFKGATSLLIGKESSMNLKPNQMKEVFQSIASNLNMRKGKSAGMSTRKENTFFNNNFSDAIPSLNNTRVNYISDKKELNLRLSPTKIATGRPQTIQNQRQKQDQSAVSVKSKLNTQNTDKNSFLRRSNNDQDIPLVPFFAEDVDHREVSHDILKLCNIIRDKHHKTSILRKSSGLGGGANPNKYTQLQDAMISTKSMNSQVRTKSDQVI